MKYRHVFNTVNAIKWSATNGELGADTKSYVEQILLTNPIPDERDIVVSVLSSLEYTRATNFLWANSGFAVLEGLNMWLFFFNKLIDSLP